MLDVMKVIDTREAEGLTSGPSRDAELGMRMEMTIGRSWLTEGHFIAKQLKFTKANGKHSGTEKMRLTMKDSI